MSKERFNENLIEIINLIRDYINIEDSGIKISPTKRIKDGFYVRRQTINLDTFVIEFPSTIHTYFGHLTFLDDYGYKGGNSEKKFLEYITEELGLKMIRDGYYEGGTKIDANGNKSPMRRDTFGYREPLYLITKIKDKKLDISDSSDYMDYYKCKCLRFYCTCKDKDIKSWNEVKAYFCEHFTDKF